jgi:hypothetical protein
MEERITDMALYTLKEQISDRLQSLFSYNGISLPRRCSIQDVTGGSIRTQIILNYSTTLIRIYRPMG